MSNIYRIYEEVDFKYQDAIVKCTKRDMIKILDEMITPDRFQKILVIEHNSEEHSDSTFYLYLGNYDEYLMFREIILAEEDKILQEYYEFIDPYKIKQWRK